MQYIWETQIRSEDLQHRYAIKICDKDLQRIVAIDEKDTQSTCTIKIGNNAVRRSDGTCTHTGRQI